MGKIAVKKLDKLITNPLDEGAECEHGKPKRVSTEESRAKTAQYKKKKGIKHVLQQEIDDYLIANLSGGTANSKYNEAYKLILAATRGNIKEINDWLHSGPTLITNAKKENRNWVRITYDKIREILSGSVHYHFDEDSFNFVENAAPARQANENDKYEVDPTLSPESKEKREQEVIKELKNERDELQQQLRSLSDSKVRNLLKKESLDKLTTDERDSVLESIKMFIDSRKSKVSGLKTKFNSAIDMYHSSGLISPTLSKYEMQTKNSATKNFNAHLSNLESTLNMLEAQKADQMKRLEQLKKQREDRHKNVNDIENSQLEAGHVDASQLDDDNDKTLDIHDLNTDKANDETLNSLIQELERSLQETEHSIAAAKSELEGTTNAQLASQTIGEREDSFEIILDDEEEERKRAVHESLTLNEKVLYKDIELALSFFENPEFRNYSEFTFKDHNSKRSRAISDPRKKQLKLIQLAIAKYMGGLKQMNKSGALSADEARAAKRDIFDKLKQRYFRAGNEFAISLSDRPNDGFSFDVKEVQTAKEKNRAARNYVNQNAPNKDTFFIYNLSDVYSIISELFDIELSEHAKGLIEGIVNRAVERFKREADDNGYVAHHTISHGLNTTLHKFVKLIEKYINSRRNVHIKAKFHFSSDEREKLIEVVKREISRHEFSENTKSSKLLSRISSMRL